ncbi:MAG: YdcF family protein [Candidatus Synoicihabitans palmerolidicus]|nr:YdcF family protein [Candidatus Synoicihabitans palmerolidicus]
MSVVLLLQLIGLLLLIFRRRIAGTALAVLGLIVLIVSSHEATADWLIYNLESQHPPAYTSAHAPLPAALESCTYIAVLGGGHNLTERQAAVGRLGSASLGRLTEAVRLAYLLPQSKLLMCGPVGKEIPDAHATVLAAAELGISPNRITLLSNVRDTFDEVHAIKAVVGDAPVALVTSAWHMPRAHGIALKIGLNFVACPAAFTLAPTGNPPSAWRKFSLGGLDHSSKATHEYLGLLWTKLRGQR